MCDTYMGRGVWDGRNGGVSMLKRFARIDGRSSWADCVDLAHIRVVYVSEARASDLRRRARSYAEIR